MYKIIEKIDDNTTSKLKLSVFYDKGGYNCWTGREKERGIKPTRPNSGGVDLVKPEGWMPPSHEDNLGEFKNLYE